LGARWGAAADHRPVTEKETDSMNGIKAKIGAGVTLAALGGLTAFALSGGEETQASTTASQPVEVRTQTIRRTERVVRGPKRSSSGPGPGAPAAAAPAPAPASAAPAAVPAPAPAPAPVTTRSSGGDDDSGHGRGRGRGGDDDDFEVEYEDHDDDHGGDDDHEDDDD
jgi:hypothetical protein